MQDSQQSFNQQNMHSGVVNVYGEGWRGLGAGNTRSYVWMNSSPACLSAAEICVATSTVTLCSAFHNLPHESFCLQTENCVQVRQAQLRTRGTAVLRPLL